MKAKPAEIGRALDQARGDVRLYLFHGPDEATARALADRLGKALGADAERVDLDPGQLKSNPGLLADEAAALSLFGGARWIRVLGAGDECADAAELLLSAPRAGNPVAMIAPALKASARLVKLGVADAGAMACQLYPPEGVAADRLAAEIARGLGLRLAPDAAAMIAGAVGGDRALMTREIEKLALFLDADAEHPRDADRNAVETVGAQVSDADLGPAVDALVAGEPDRLGTELEELGATSRIPLLRAMLRRLSTLADLRAQLDAGARADSLLDRVFWKERDATLAALRRWPSAALADALDQLREAERVAMIGIGDVGADMAVVAICRRMGRAV